MAYTSSMEPNLHLALKSYQRQVAQKYNEKSLKTAPIPVKNFFISYIKQMQATTDILDCVGNLFESNKVLLKSNSLFQRLTHIRQTFSTEFEKLTNDLIDELDSSSRLSTTSQCNYLMNNDNVQFGSSNEDSQLGFIVDQFVEGKNKREIDNSILKRCKVEKISDEWDSSEDDKTLRSNLNYDKDGFLIVYVDGACSYNGSSKAVAGYGVWFNYNHPLNVSASVSGTPTNNNAEIQAATKAILQANRIGIRKIRILSDSKFLINCMTQWIHKWKKNNWMNTNKEKVKNEESLKQLDYVMPLMNQVQWEYVEAHKGIEGNEQADALAKRGATMYRENRL